MKRFCFVLFAFSLLIFGTLSPNIIAPLQGQSPDAKFRKGTRVVAGQYIVTFKDETPRDKIAASARKLARVHGGRILFIYEDAIKGFAVELPEAAAIALSRNPQVEEVAENGISSVVGAESTPQGPTTFWGLDRIDQPDLPVDNTYNYNRVGSGVHAYILDTGIWATHRDFGTRAKIELDTFGGDGVDRNNHGTFVAGVLGGRAYGVAKNVRLHALKVCDDSPLPQCPDANIIAGLNWVISNHIKPAVVNLSFTKYSGSSTYNNVDNAVRNTINAGITCVIGAGNDNANAINYSPAHVVEGITVGATTRTDGKASYSNFGNVVDIFAPGGQAPDHYIPVPASGYFYGGSNDPADGGTGTSLAAPHVAGAVAQYLETYSLYSPADGATLPANVGNAITSNATFNRLSGIQDSPNRLLYSGFVAPPGSNPVDDQLFFVRQHYYDFLRRQPDTDGWNYWTSQITQCGSDPTCIDNKRVDVSLAFWYASEFLDAHPGLRNPPGVTPDFNNAEFVRQCYLVYLQRNPSDPPDSDLSGYNFWLGELNNDTANYSGGIAYMHLIRAFLQSPEYRARFQ
jgi:serine protease